MSNYKDSRLLRKELVKTNNIFESLKFFRVLVVSFIAFFVIAITIVRITTINGNSMYPTMQDGELALINIFDRYIEGIDRFDIVTVYDEREGLFLAKRVVALPNETIQYKDDKLYINGECVEETFLDQSYIKSQTNNNSINFTEDYGPLVLKENEYFLVGDNRRISIDSRRYGPYNKKDIVSNGIFVLMK